MANDNLPPLDEDRLSERLRLVLGQLEKIGMGICKTVIHLENMHSELLVRRLTREGKTFVADEFGKKE